MKKLVLYAAAASVAAAVSVPVPAQAAVKVYTISGSDCCRILAELVGCGRNPGSSGELGWFPGQGPEIQGNGSGELEWFPGQGPDIQGNDSGELEWFPGQGPDIQGNGSGELEWFPGQGPEIQGNGSGELEWFPGQGPDNQGNDDGLEWFPNQGWQQQVPEQQMPEQQWPGQQTPSQGNSQARAYIDGLIELVNRERAAAGLSPVTEDSRLTAAATIRAQETAVSFSHTRPGGGHFSSVLTQNGISFMGAGENIAYGYPTPEAVMNGWMNSAGHRANILNGSYTKIGIGYYQSGGTIYCTQLFTY